MKGNTMFEKISEFSNSKKGFYFIIIASLLIKTLTLILMSDMAINRDGTQYIAAAQQFAQGNFKEGFSFHSMPSYPLVIAIVNFVIQNWLLSARLISIGSLVLAIIPLYLITRDLFNTQAAFWGCLAFLVTPEVNQLAMEVLRDPLFIFCLLWSIYFAQRSIQKKDLLSFSLAVIFLWAPFLFRIEGIIMPPFYFIFLSSLLCVFVFEKQDRLHYLKGMIIWIVFFIFLVTTFWVVIGPEYVSFNKLNTVVSEIQKISGFRVGESYRKIYEQLKMLEEMSLYPSGNQNFAEVARHYMPIIYIIGFVEILVKNMFVLFLVPLIWGFRSSYSRRHIFLIAFAGYYLLIIFYTYVERDFIQTRFLLVPSILLYPWIGFGMQKIFLKVKASSRPQLFLAICLVFFIFMPLGKFANTMAVEDRTICAAGKWIQSNPEFQNIKFYANDSRIAFHAGWTRGDFENIVHEYYKNKRNKDWTLEQFALENQIDLVVLRISRKKIKSAPTFMDYKKLKEFKERKNIVRVYCSPDFCSKLD